MVMAAMALKPAMAEEGKKAADAATAAATDPATGGATATTTVTDSTSPTATAGSVAVPVKSEAVIKELAEMK